MKTPEINCVIVTFNRIDKLKKVLKSYENQTCTNFNLTIVDNNSTDGTIDFLKKWYLETNLHNKEIVFLNENTGGAGGFYCGIKTAINHPNNKWVLVADDDAYPEKDLIEKLMFCIAHTSSEIGAICSKVLDKNGNIELDHRRYLRKGLFKISSSPVEKKEYLKDFFYFNTFSFVGTCINVKAIRKIGLPHNDFFIWCDDTEYSFRMNKYFKIICYPSFVFIHEDNQNPKIVLWKLYYGKRNYLVSLKENFPIRYYYYEKISLKFWYLKHLLLRKPDAQIIRDAIKDGKKRNLGKNPKYGPW